MERTLAILKPDCIEKKLEGKVIDKILEDGFEIVQIKMVRLSERVARNFYKMHKNRPFYPALIEFMSEGPIMVAVLQKENAIENWRELMGATDPSQADEGTIRNTWADSTKRNIVHGSDSPEAAEREMSFFFSEYELLS